MEPAGCSTDEVTGDRSTLLHIAAWKGHSDLIAQLCRWGNGSLITSVNSSGYTPLHCAAGAGHAGAVEAIIRALAAGANVEEGRLQEILRGRNEAGDTPLHLAARHGHGEAAEALVRVDPGLAAELNGAGVSSLYLAVMSGSVRAVRAILWCRNASAVGPKSQNALHAAVLQSSGDYFVDNLAFYICTGQRQEEHTGLPERRGREYPQPLEEPPALGLLPSPTLPLVVIVGDHSQRCHGAAIPIDLLSPHRNTATSLFVHIANLGQCQRLGMKRMPLPTASSVATMPRASNECRCHLSTSEVGAIGFDEATATVASSTIGTVSSTAMGERREITVAVVSSGLEPPLCRRANPAAGVASAAISLTAACLPSPLVHPAVEE
uniref:Uncharacterized protein n=2 Tax=Oryza sativa subsp. japonica TaxID=39947 RepID=Q53NT8_ORYSJ|nr:hypothetical protein [Oryza sativa Japonica Group]AAX96538.1 hypothetical protein LOC_Os11g24770 [Oryza sativa Japonica Group]ABA93224.1 hypothetical protein LOC_Os11g24770 [Oryza sativa Japonica Group]